MRSGCVFLPGMLGQPEGGWTYAGIVADALAYYRLECEFAFVKHGYDGRRGVVSRVRLDGVATRGHVGGLCYRRMM